MKFLPLDADKIQGLISLLSAALQGGYKSSASSPVDILLESAIDLSLLLADVYQEGIKFRKDNPGLKFSQKFSDPLGNPKQMKIRFETKIAWDPQAAQFFKELAVALVRLKRGDSFKGAFMALLDKFPEFKSPPVSPEGSQCKSKGKKSSSKQKRTQYYRRQLDKTTKTKF